MKMKQIGAIIFLIVLGATFMLHGELTWAEKKEKKKKSKYIAILESTLLCAGKGDVQKSSNGVESCMGPDGSGTKCLQSGEGCCEYGPGGSLGGNCYGPNDKKGEQGLGKEKHQGGQVIAPVGKSDISSEINKLLGSGKAPKANAKLGATNDEALDAALGARPVPPKVKDAPQVAAPPSNNTKSPKGKLPATVVVIPAAKKAGGKSSAAATVAPKAAAPATKKAGPKLKPAPVTGKKAPVAPVAMTPVTKAPSPGAVAPNPTPPKIIEGKTKVAPH